MKINDQVILQKLGKSFVAYDNNNSVFHEFNDVGYVIIKGVEKGDSMNKIVKNIMKDFEVTKDQALSDVEEFLAELEKKDLITR